MSSDVICIQFCSFFLSRVHAIKNSNAALLFLVPDVITIDCTYDQTILEQVIGDFLMNARFCNDA